MAKQHFDIVLCAVCQTVKAGGTVYYDKAEPFNLDKHCTVCDDCSADEEETDG